MGTRLLFFAMVFPCFAFGHTSNPYLQYTMKAIAKDVELVSAATKVPNAIDVTDGMILTGIIRARTTLSQLQLLLDRAGKFENGKLIKDEMTPAIDELSLAKQKELIELYPQYLGKAKAKLVAAEQELKVQLAEMDSDRTFAPLKAILTDLATVMAEAHKLFKH